MENKNIFLPNDLVYCTEVALKNFHLTEFLNSLSIQELKELSNIYSIKNQVGDNKFIKDRIDTMISFKKEKISGVIKRVK